MKNPVGSGSQAAGDYGTHSTSVRLSPGDMELLQLVQNKLNLSRGEALRTCLRSYVYVLKEVMK